MNGARAIQRAALLLFRFALGLVLSRTALTCGLLRPLPDGAEPEPLPTTLVAPPLPAPTDAEIRSASRRRRTGLIISHVLRAAVTCYLIGLIVAIIVEKGAFLKLVALDPVFKIYGVAVAGYVVSRFLISAFYRPSPHVGLEPSVAVVVPAFNEQDVIVDTVEAILAVDYPADKLEVVLVDDGSTDGTLAAMEPLAEADPRVRLISFPENRGKRAAMAKGIRSSTADVVAFVDSDSVLESDGLRMIVQAFADPAVGGVAGHTDVFNECESWLTRMQAVRYFVAFRVLKAAESVFGAVTCCSGCFAAYRREAIMPDLEAWEHQLFLGHVASFGDDRSLTNFVLRHWKVTYESRAVSRTVVPSTFRVFMTQQLRWKRSWSRESLILGRIIWRKHPLTAIATYISIVLPLVSPIVAVRALVWRPLVGGHGAPLYYLLGLYSVALLYGLYYTVRKGRNDTLWLFGVLFVFFYLAFLLWQTYYALLTANRSEWGTRPSTHAVAEVPG